jgi:hypothetical protein
MAVSDAVAEYVDNCGGGVHPVKKRLPTNMQDVPLIMDVKRAGKIVFNIEGTWLAVGRTMKE